jgi:cation diffusion facilitator family transporter
MPDSSLAATANLTRAKLRFGLLSLAVSGGLVALKFWAWRLTHSQVVLSDALESIVNIVTSGFALWSVWLASLPRDQNHPYGHGKVEHLSVGLEGALIFGAGLFILVGAGASLVQPHPVGRLDWGIGVLAFTAVANLATGWWLVRGGRQLHSLALEGDGKHLYLDAISTIVGVASLVGVMLTGWIWLDSVAALGMGVFITWQGGRMLRRAVGSLLDETDPDTVAELVDTLEKNRRPRWIDVHNLRVQMYGPDLHVDAHVSLPYYLSLTESHAEISAIEELVRHKGPGQQVELFLHADPCEPPRQCPHCQVLDCPVRERPFIGLIPWTPDNAMRNERHGARVI